MPSRACAAPGSQYGARRGHECPQAAFRSADRTSSSGCQVFASCRLPPGRPSTPLTAETRAEDDPRPGSFTSSGFQKAKLLERRDAIVETDLFRNLAILDTEYGCPGEPHLATGCRRKRAEEEIAERRPGVRAATLPPAHDVITLGD